MNQGILFKYKDKEGTQLKCVAYTKDQTISLLAADKLIQSWITLIRLLSKMGNQ